MPKEAIIIGAGPAGLTAAYELLKRTDIVPIVLEKSGDIGGISKTINYKGNRMDMGPHRFFSKSDRVMEWWLNIMPLEEGTDANTTIKYQNKTRTIKTDPAGSLEASGKRPENSMLVIQRLTRIYFLRRFFAYPIQLGFDTLKTLGFVRTVKILASFLWVRLFPRKPEKTLEDFIINKFGRQLYLLFFKDYTEKVWGVPCHEISAEWGAQRIKGVSLSKAIGQAIKSLAGKKGGNKDINQKNTETSLIDQFLYPKHGSGSLWEEVGRQVQEMGGKIYLNQQVQKIDADNQKITSVVTLNTLTGQSGAWEGDYFFSTMPVQELIAGMGSQVPADVSAVAKGLQYRDFINVGILLKRLSKPVGKEGEYERLELKDNWIYIQERDVRVGRLMIYNNWGDGMIKDADTTWVGMEYFCNKSEIFWQQDDEFIKGLAIEELGSMGLINVEDVLDATVQRMEKTYPAYFGTYEYFGKIREYTDEFANLFLVGRNGMHKYNNADHSMLTAMVAVDNIISGNRSKVNLWSINTEQEYHEEKTANKYPISHQNALPVPVVSFWKDYLWKNKINRAWWLTGLIAFLIQFAIFKFRYPFANYMPDSYSYLEAAYTNADVNMWPVAYSKFLRLLSVFTHSDKLVVGLQYLFIQVSALMLLFSLFYWLKPGTFLRTFLLIFFILNPLPLFVSNYISADSLFIGLSVLWMTSLFWILFRPRPFWIILQGMALLSCFTVRYNAIYYPLVAILAFTLSKQRWIYKLFGISVAISLVLSSVIYTSQKMKTTTGKRQFSAFAGWQLANNALYMYEQISAKDREPVPTKFSKLEIMVRRHMDTLNKIKLTHDDSINTFFYLWSGRGPLIKYMTDEYQKDSITSYFKKWSSEGPLYKNYALYLITKYPRQYATAFMIPNTIKYAVPPLEFLGIYNMGHDSVGKMAKDWFNYKTLKIQDHSQKKDDFSLIEWYPIYNALINVLFIICLIGFFTFSPLRNKQSQYLNLTLLTVTFWLLNFCFSIIASPIVLRYQVLPMLLYLTISSLLLEQLLTDSTEIKNKIFSIQ